MGARQAWDVGQPYAGPFGSFNHRRGGEQWRSEIRGQLAIGCQSLPVLFRGTLGVTHGQPQLLKLVDQAHSLRRIVEQ